MSIVIWSVLMQALVGVDVQVELRHQELEHFLHHFMIFYIISINSPVHHSVSVHVDFDHAFVLAAFRDVIDIVRRVNCFFV